MDGLDVCIDSTLVYGDANVIQNARSVVKAVAA